LESDRFSRNEALFGAEGQQRIAATRVTIVGLGGLGSHVVQQLAYLGVQDYRLIDFDVVTESSMNRLIGAVDADVEAQTEKVVVGERVIRSVLPEADVDKVEARIETPEAAAAVAAADVVFGCLDRDRPRLKLTEISCRHARPLFDLATDTGGEGDELWYGGRVLFANGRGCLVCHQLLDQEEIARDSMTTEQRAAEDRIYGVRRDRLGDTGPMVVSVNGVVASLAVTEFMAFVTGLRPPATQLIYRGEVPSVRRVLDEPESGCYFCEGLWGTALRT
jgi:molybdopterin-synthase adenylyltransferase